MPRSDGYARVIKPMGFGHGVGADLLEGTRAADANGPCSGNSSTGVVLLSREVVVLLRNDSFYAGKVHGWLLILCLVVSTSSMISSCHFCHILEEPPTLRDQESIKRGYRWCTVC